MKHTSFLKLWVAAAALVCAGSPTMGQSVDDLLKKGDVHDKRFEATEAMKFYSAAEKEEPNNPKLLLRIARQYRHLMADANSKWEKLRLGGLGLSYAQKAVQVAPNDAEAHLSVAISHGKLLPIQGSREQAQGSTKIKAAIDRSIRLDPNDDTAWYILGRWHRVLADVSPVKRAFAPLVAGKLPTGSNDEALRCLQKAIAINPRRPMHHIELGRIYAQMDRPEEARQALQKGLSLPNTDKDDAESKAAGREVLASLK